MSEVWCGCTAVRRCAEGERLWERVQVAYERLRSVMLVGDYVVCEEAWHRYQEALEEYRRHLEGGL